MKKVISLLSVLALLCGCLMFAGCSNSADALDGKKLVTFGDSITASGTWPASVAEGLNMYLFNAAKGATTSKDGLDRFDEYVAPQQPQYVTLSFGMNDMIMQAKNKPRVTLEKYRANMTELGNRVVALGAVPIFLTVSYLNNKIFYSAQGQDKSDYSDYESPLALLDEYNAVVREVAAQNNWDLIDIRSACDEYAPEKFLSDGIHLADLGNQVYTSTIVDYMNAHFKRDKNAKPLPTLIACTDTPNEAAETSIIGFDPDEAGGWHTAKDTVTLTAKDGALEIANTNGQWPTAGYIKVPAIRCPLEGSEIAYDFTTAAGVATSIILCFNLGTPDAHSDQQYVILNKFLKDAKIEAGSGDIKDGQTLKGSVKLSDLHLPDGAFDKAGNVIVSGVQIYAAGKAGKPVTFRKLAVASVGAPK